MHQNHYFLKHLATALNKQLIDTKIDSAFVQQKNELLIRFVKGIEEVFLLAHFGGNFCCLAFPHAFARKKINTVDVFDEIKGCTVEDISVFDNERAMCIRLSDKKSLVIQLFGNRSNIILYDNDRFVRAFRKKFSDPDKPLGSFNRVDETLGQSPPGLAGFPLQLFNEHPSPTISQFVQTLEKVDSYYIVDYRGRLRLSLIPIEAVIESFNDPMEATTAFFYRYIKVERLQKGKSQLSTKIKKQIARTSNYLHKSEKKLREIDLRNYQQIGDVLMANLSNISPGAKSITLHNFYTGKDEVIKLNPELSAQRNAENFYRKSKNQSRELESIQQNIAAKRRQLDLLTAKLEQLDQVSDTKELRKFTSEKQPEKAQVSLPYYEREFSGYRILIGKGAKQNDQLIQSFATKNDLWLHVKDGPGSHVIIKQIPGRDFPSDVIEHAASLAGYYSKRKTDSLTPVIYTPRKHVRKRKGDPAGLVVVEKEKVILVEPSKG